MWRSCLRPLLLLALIISSCSCFVVPGTTPLVVDRAIVPTISRARPSQMVFLKLSKKDDDKPKSYVPVEDGSPLGVAIVVLGSFLLLNSDIEDKESYGWVVFVTASVAAGISRLIRNRK